MTRLPAKAAYVYILHFTTPIHHATHYSGVTTQLRSRLRRHLSASGASLTAEARRLGITWHIGAVASCRPEEMFEAERKLKRQRHLARYCSACSGPAVRRIPGTLPLSPESVMHLGYTAPRLEEDDSCTK